MIQCEYCGRIIQEGKQYLYKTVDDKMVCDSCFGLNQHHEELSSYTGCDLGAIYGKHVWVNIEDLEQTILKLRQTAHKLYLNMIDNKEDIQLDKIKSFLKDICNWNI